MHFNQDDTVERLAGSTSDYNKLTSPRHPSPGIPPNHSENQQIGLSTQPNSPSSSSSSPSRKSVSFSPKVEETHIETLPPALKNTTTTSTHSMSKANGDLSRDDLATFDPFYKDKLNDEREDQIEQKKRASVFDTFLSGRLSSNLSPEEVEFKKQWNLENGIEDSEVYSEYEDESPKQFESTTTTTTTHSESVNPPVDAHISTSHQPYQAGMVDTEKINYGNSAPTSFTETTTTTTTKKASSKHGKRRQSTTRRLLSKIPAFQQKEKVIPTQRRISIMDLKAITPSGNKRGLSVATIMLSFIAALSGFSFGYNTGVISGVLFIVRQELSHPFDLTYEQKQMMTSATIITALIATIFGGFLADKLGRKLILLLSCIFYISSCAIMATSYSLTKFIWGRAILGLGVGLSSFIAPMYISELAPALHRGKMVLLYVFMITLGQLMSYTMGAAMNDTRDGWRYMVGIGGIPGCIQLISLIFLPESPRFLLFKGKVIQARKVLKTVCPGLTEEEIVARLKLMNCEKLSFTQSLGELFSKPAHTRALVIGCGLQAMQQLSGFNMLMYYSGTLLKALGYRNPMAVAMVVAGTNCAFTIIAFAIIDKVNRRRLLLWTIPGMAFGLLWISVSYNCIPRWWFNFAAKYEQNGWNAVMLTAMVVFVAFYALGIGNLPWHQGEMFPTSVRGVGTSITTSINWTINLIFSIVFLTMFERMGPVWTFALFGLLCITSEIFTYFVYPDLAGLGIEEIDCLLTSGFGIKESIIIREDRKLFGLIDGEAI